MMCNPTHHGREEQFLKKTGDIFLPASHLSISLEKTAKIVIPQESGFF
jgi:hypothetical protein